MSPADQSAQARAGQDWKDGLSYDENPYQPGTRSNLEWQREMNRLLAEELKREMMEMVA